ncbi:MAG: baseplate wedge protein 53 [archaeon]
MSRIRYDSSSVYSATQVTNTYLDLYVPPLEPDFSTSINYTIEQKYHHRPDLLAYDKYGDSKYWWLFALYNKDTVKDPMFDIETGKQILIPKDLTNIGK